MSSVVKKVKQGVKIAKDVITGRPKAHHSTGVVGHNIRPNPFSDLRNPNKPIPHSRRDDLPSQYLGRPDPRFTNLIGSSMGEATSEIPSRPRPDANFPKYQHYK